MDYETAHQLILHYGQSDSTDEDNFLGRLSHGQSPIPGQVTEILLALKVAFDALRDEPNLDRPLVLALHTLAFESRRQFNAGIERGVEWPPLLDEDLGRMAIAIHRIFAGVWHG
jgi:hypothetical protein